MKRIQRPDRLVRKAKPRAMDDLFVQMQQGPVPGTFGQNRPPFCRFDGREAFRDLEANEIAIAFDESQIRSVDQLRLVESISHGNGFRLTQ